MNISVIIPTKNGEQTIKQLFSSLAEQTLRTEEILVIDSSSDDNTIPICKALGITAIRIAAQDFDHGGTRNLAASLAMGDILVFMTQDTAFRNSRGLEKLVEPLLNNKEIAASYARQIPRNNANFIERFARFFNYPATGIIKGSGDLSRLGIKTFFLSNTCSAVKKQAFEEVGGFPEKTIMNEDMFLAARLIQHGYKIAYQADAAVHHSHNYSLAAQFKRYFDIGVFFARNRWIADMAKSEKEGIRYLQGLIKFLIKNSQWNMIPYALIETVTRFFGYRFGLLEKKLPLRLKKRISNNPGFWARKK